MKCPRHQLTMISFKNEVNNSQVLLPHCSPRQVWLLARHGARNPSLDDMEEMETSLPKLRDNILAAFDNEQSGLDTEQVEALREWRWVKVWHFFLLFTFTFFLFYFLLLFGLISLALLFVFTSTL